MSTLAAALLWRYRLSLAAACAVATLAAATVLPELEVSNSLHVWYPRNDPAIAEYEQFRDRFGSDEIVVVAVSRPAGFLGDAGTEAIAELTDRLLDVPGVANVMSRVTVPQSLSEVQGRLQSDDGTTAVLLVQTMPDPQSDRNRHRLLEDIRAAVGESGVQGRYAGYGVIYDALNDASTRGSALLLAGAHLLMLGLLWYIFRKPLPVVLTVVAVGMATAWTMALFVAAGRQLNMVTMALPTLIWVMGIADCLHLFRSVARLGRAAPRADAVTSGVARVIAPCALTTLTTAAGFLALTTSDLPLVRDLGLFGALGMIAAFVASVTVTVAGLSLRAAIPECRDRPLATLAKSLHGVGDRYPLRTIGAFGLVALIALIGMTRLTADTDSIAYLPGDHEVRTDSEFIEREIGPYMPLDFVITTTGKALSPAVLDALQSWQTASRSIPGVGWSWSVLDALGIHGPAAPSALPRGTLRARLERTRHFAPASLKYLISDDNQLRVSFGVPVLSAGGVRKLTSDLLEVAAFAGHASVRAAGYTPLYIRIVDSIVQSQLKGFAVALALIVAMLGIAMRSLKKLGLALACNGLPVAFTLGTMGFLGIPLDVATVTIAAVILGLVVDDTVHLLHGSDDPQSLRASVRRAARGTGTTLLLTSAVLGTGFLLLGLADIRSIAWFGGLAAFAVVVAVMTDLLLLPALARIDR